MPRTGQGRGHVRPGEVRTDPLRHHCVHEGYVSGDVQVLADVHRLGWSATSLHRLRVVQLAPDRLVTHIADRDPCQEPAPGTRPRPTSRCVDVSQGLPLLLGYRRLPLALANDLAVVLVETGDAWGHECGTNVAHVPLAPLGGPQSTALKLPGHARERATVDDVTNGPAQGLGLLGVEGAVHVVAEGAVWP